MMTGVGKGRYSVKQLSLEMAYYGMLALILLLWYVGGLLVTIGSSSKEGRNMWGIQ